MYENRLKTMRINPCILFFTLNLIKETQKLNGFLEIEDMKIINRGLIQCEDRT